MSSDVSPRFNVRAVLEATGLGLGAAQLGNLSRVTSDEDAAAAITASWNGGVRYFDTAPHYGLGLSERRLGTVLSEYPRDQYILSTKVGRLIVPDPDWAGGSLDPEGFAVPASSTRRWDFSRDGVLRSLEDSLIRLGVDRIDVVYLHDAESHWQQALNEALPTLQQLREEGVIAAIGAGLNFSAPAAELVRDHDVDVVMIAGRYTLLDQTAAADLLPAAMDREVSVVAAGVYNSGLASTSSISASAHFDYQQASRAQINHARAVAAICDQHRIPVPVAAIHFPLRHPAVVAVAVGARDGDQARSNLERLHTPVPEDLWAHLRAEGLTT